MGVGPYAMGIVFWIFMAIVAVAGIFFDYMKRRLELQPIKAAIERGQQIDPAIIERLMAQSTREHTEIEPLHLRIGGIITIATGAGVALLAFFIRFITPVAFYPVMGGAVVVVCIGIGLLIATHAVEQHQRQQAPP